eukprot:ANDGO_03773.mRNA.1 hypothetical protein
MSSTVAEQMSFSAVGERGQEQPGDAIVDTHSGLVDSESQQPTQLGAEVDHGELGEDVGEEVGQEEDPWAYDDYGDEIDYSKFPYSWKRKDQPYRACFWMGYGVFKVMHTIGAVIVGILGLEEDRFAEQRAAVARRKREEEERKREMEQMVEHSTETGDKNI